MNTTFEFTGEDVPVMADDLAKDFFPTPMPVVRASVVAIDLITPPSVILDPSAGDGRWGHVAQKRWLPRMLMGADLRDIAPAPNYDLWHPGDFLTWTPPSRSDLIVTNPPFSIWEYFVEHGLDLLTATGSLVLFLRVQALGGRYRHLHFYGDKHLRHVYYLASRVAFIKKLDPKTGHMRPVADVWDYGLLVFDQQHHDVWTGSWYDYKTTKLPKHPALPTHSPDLNRSNVVITPEVHTLRLF